MRNIYSFVLTCVLILTFSIALAQGDILVGDEAVEIGLPLDTKMIDVGFSNRDFINVSTVNRTNHIMLRWHQSKFDTSIVRFEVRVGVPICAITEKDFGLIPINDIAELPTKCLNFTQRWVDVGTSAHYLLKVNGFSYVVQVLALKRTGGIAAISQIRYIKQR